MIRKLPVPWNRKVKDRDWTLKKVAENFTINEAIKSFDFRSSAFFVTGKALSPKEKELVGCLLLADCSFWLLRTNLFSTTKDFVLLVLFFSFVSLDSSLCINPIQPHINQALT